MEDTKVSRRGAMAKIAGLATAGYFAPTMSVMADGHSDASSSSSASSTSSVSSASSAAGEPSMWEASVSDASDWSAPSIASTGNSAVDDAADSCADSSTGQESFEQCLSDAGLQIAN